MGLSILFSHSENHTPKHPGREYPDSLKSGISDIKTCLQEIGEADKAMVNQTLKRSRTRSTEPLFKKGKETTAKISQMTSLGPTGNSCEPGVGPGSQMKAEFSGQCRSCRTGSRNTKKGPEQ